MNNHYTIFPLGDCAATIELGTEMSEELNEKILSMQRWFDKNPSTGIRDTIIAYSSLTLVYDPVEIKKSHPSFGTAYEWVFKQALQAYRESDAQRVAGSSFRVGVCYDREFGTDLEDIHRATRLSLEGIIERHLSRTYRVYMLGFLPGFAYMGEIDQSLYMPRKQTPVHVVAGSVGIVSNQTCIYPLNSPGGWQIIGRTSMKLFNPSDEIPVKLKPGDQIQFYRITREEFERESE
ncbi:MAG TPA: 5-oxoprolinase subunit PxpB [Flavitalea sp.]|nr:5-oxoprolinase subunit PxpB [Flavitalea sp.]